jgi:HAD superfamily hydrolase (TIGR01509 family)
MAIARDGLELDEMARDIRALPLPRAMLFDLDGTLVDTVELRISAWEEALAWAGLPTRRAELAPLIGLDGKRLAREVAALAGAPIDEARSEEIDRRSGEIYQRRNRAPQPLPGIRRLIAALEGRAIAWAIATSSRKEQVTASVAALGLAKEPTIVDASHVKHAKPEPDLLLIAAKELGVEPAASWYVGDSTWDMVSAVAAGMIAIGATAGSAVDAATLEGAGAAAVVTTLDEVVAAIEDR